jgi:hypothetical protein
MALTGKEQAPVGRENSPETAPDVFCVLAPHVNLSVTPCTLGTLRQTSPLKVTHPVTQASKLLALLPRQGSMHAARLGALMQAPPQNSAISLVALLMNDCRAGGSVRGATVVGSAHLHGQTKTGQ